MSTQLVWDAVAIAALYLSSVVLVAVLARGRWRRWQEREHPGIARQGDYGGGMFLLVAVLWPILLWQFLLYSARPRSTWWVRPVDVANWWIGRARHGRDLHDESYRRSLLDDEERERAGWPSGHRQP